MQPRFSHTLFLLALLSVGHGAVADEMTIDAPDGRRISVIADFPSGPGPHAAMVLAPGQGYHMNLPAMAETARALVGQGVAAFRFNWTYFTAQPRREPSADLSKELEDFQAVVAAARAHPRIDGTALSAGGKSLGSLVAWRALRADPQLRAALLLTPVCSRVTKGESRARSEAKQNYPGFDTEQRLVLFIAGDSDPLCAPAVLYSFAATTPGRARVAIVGGDHGYESTALSMPAAEMARKRNLAAVSALAAGFAAEVSSHER